jgi:hypothetical protein
MESVGLRKLDALKWRINDFDFSSGRFDGQKG